MTDAVANATPESAVSPQPRDIHSSALPPNWQRGFWALIVTQFQNAFNDNAIKFLVIYIIVAMNFPEGQRDFLVLVVGALFALPFIFFSMTGGYFADRYSKRSVVIGTKLMEIVVMAVAIAGLAMRSLPIECAAVFLISTQSALFGPSKYGLLPELLPEQKLSWGNGIIELGTFLGSISAVMAAGFLAAHFRGRQEMSGVILLGCTLIGLTTSFAISRVPAADPTKRFRWNPLGDLFSNLKIIRGDRVLSWAVVGNTYLWFLAALLQFTIVIYGHDVLHVDEAHISLLQAAVGIGIGIGSFAAGYLSGGKIEYGLIPIGAIGMTVFGALLYNPGHSLQSAAWHLGLLGFFGGFFAVPLNALIQHRPRREEKGGVIAAANLLSFVGVFLAAGAYYLFASGLTSNRAGNFPGWRDSYGGDDDLCRLPAAGFTFAAGVVDGDAFDLPDSRGGAREHSGDGRGAFRCESYVAGRCAVAACVDGPADSIFDVQGDLRSAVCEAGREDDSCDSDFVGVAAARDAAIVARGEQRDSRGRSGLHFCRRADYAHRAAASLPARDGTDHEGRGCSDRARESRRRVGQYFQLRAREVLVEDAAIDSVPGHREFREADAGDFDAFRSTRGGAATADRGVPVSQKTDAHTAARIYPHCAWFAFSLRDGRQAAGANELGNGAAERDFARATVAQHVGGTGNGWDFAAAVGAGRAGEFCGGAVGEDPGQFELHLVERDARIMRAAVRASDGDHYEAVARAHSAEGARENNFIGRSGGFTAVRRKDSSAAALVPAGILARADSEPRETEDARRSRYRDFFEREHRRTEGRDADALQHRVEHRADGADVRVGAQGRAARRAAVFSFFRIHCDALAAGGARLRRCVSSESARPDRRKRTGARLSRDVPAGDSDISAGVPSPLLA